MMKRAAVGLLLLLTGCATRHVLFDDFNYASPDDLAKNGWIIRTEQGWPGIAGASWGRDSVSIANSILTMNAQTDGTTTRQAQICQQRKFLEGTYAARVRFSDQPAIGPNGDQIVQSFYDISPLKAPMDPDYSELDFEYLPNGGWGQTGSTLWTTTWETFQLEPWIADNITKHQSGALGGWHTLVTQVGRSVVHYFLDGQPFAEHGGKYYPESMMSINFNLWFVRDKLIPATDLRQWTEDIDWVYFRGGRVQSPQDVEATIADLRRRGMFFKDTVPSRGLTSPCNF